MKKSILLASVAMLILPAVYDSGRNCWKLDADGNLEMKDGNPIYINSNGEEQTTEPGTISRLNAEAKSNREAREKLENDLKVFKDVDPEAARKAIETVKKLDAKKLIDAGEVDRVKEEVASQFKGQISELEKSLADRESAMDSMRLDTAFNNSKWLKDNVAVPVEMVRSTFGDRVKIVDGKVTPIGADGKPLFSKKRAGEFADFDEAMSIIIDNYPHKDAILKADTKSGSGNGGGGGNPSHTGARISRSDYDSLDLDQQTQAGIKVSKGELVITD